MVRVERHHIQGTEEIVRLCSLSRDLYNRCNYLVRQAFFAHERLPGLGELVHLIHDEPCFQDFGNTKVSKQTVRQVITDWSNFFKALRVFKADPSKLDQAETTPFQGSARPSLLLLGDHPQETPEGRDHPPH